MTVSSLQMTVLKKFWPCPWNVNGTTATINARQCRPKQCAKHCFCFCFLHKGKGEWMSRIALVMPGLLWLHWVQATWKVKTVSQCLLDVLGMNSVLIPFPKSCDAHIVQHDHTCTVVASDNARLDKPFVAVALGSDMN